jgi:hypothetical protein
VSGRDGPGRDEAVARRHDAPPPATGPHEVPPLAPSRDAPPLAAVAILSAAALGYELLLMRLFSIIQWHHFAYMMISVAMLGYGAAGTFVALGRQALVARHAPVFAGAAAAFGITAVAGFLLAQQVAFNPFALLWDPREPLRLAAVYGLLFVPFFCVALALCLTFTRYGTESPRIYSYDILGAGAGCAAAIAALFAVPPAQVLLLVAAAGFAASGAAALRCGLRPRALAPVLFGIAVALPLALPAEWIRLRPSEYKDLSQALQVDGARLIAERSSPLGVVSVVESPRVPFRHAPGLSLAAPGEPPPQLALFVDGDGPTALARYDGRRESLAWLDYLPSAAPYHLVARPRVLVLGAGAGADVLQALHHGARSIDAVELDPEVVDLVERSFADFSGRPYSAPGVRVHVAEARGFVARGGARYDLIQVALLDAAGASAAGLYALSESYLYTVEAFADYLERLDAGGMLAITRWVNLPPRDVLKLFATAIAAFERRGVAEPGRQLALIRGLRTATLLVRNGAFSAADIAALREFCRVRSFDADYYPGIAAADANRHNVLDPSHFHDGAQALLGADRAGFIERYKYAIAPATDDRPHFHHFFRWASLPELVALRGTGGLPLVEWGYPVLVATLAQALLASLVLVLVPLALCGRAELPGASTGTADAESEVRGRSAAGPAGSLRVAGPTPRSAAAYFAAIGFAFMFVEIAFIQRFVLFLNHPLYAVATVLCAFLVFAGLGSRCTRSVQRIGGIARRSPLAVPVAAIAGLALLYLAALPEAFRLLAPLPDAARIAVAMALVAPLAFAMGMPFPLGLARLAATAPPLAPWAWGINACASVVAAIVATLLAIHLGFGTVVLLAVLLYVLALAAWR